MINYLTQSWRDFIHVLLDPTLEDALLVAINGAIFTFSVIAIFAAALNLGWFASLVTTAVSGFVAVIVNQYIDNFF